MPEQKYKQLVLLVHPLYDVFFPKGGYISCFHENNSQFKKAINKEKFIDELYFKTVKEKDKQIKTSLKIYGEQLKNYVTKPGTFIVFVHPVDSHFTEVDELIYNKLMAKFLKYWKSNFKDRFFTAIVSKSYTKKVGVKGFKDLISKFNKNVNIVAFGVYGDACVTNVLKQFESEFLRNKHKIYRKSITIKATVGKNDFLFVKKGFKYKSLTKKEKLKFLKKQDFTKNMFKKQFAFKKGFKSKNLPK